MAHYSSENDTSVRKDAGERGFRSFKQGLLIDVGIAVVLVLATAFTTIEWTSIYWAALGSTLAKTVLQSGVAYLMRIFVTPKQSKPI